MFSEACIILSRGGVGQIPLEADRPPHQKEHWTNKTGSDTIHTPRERTVRILLECILVFLLLFFLKGSGKLSR